MVLLLALIALLLLFLVAWQTLRDAFTYQHGFDAAAEECRVLLATYAPSFQSPFGNVTFNGSGVVT